MESVIDRPHLAVLFSAAATHQNIDTTVTSAIAAAVLFLGIVLYGRTGRILRRVLQSLLTGMKELHVAK